ncbi:MAG: MoaD/ThiS family protein [Candidatus Eisenbacteria bacterium]|nr:MoaD/ThiS family protein [Candidatus Eisenbacteria bacterium]
MRIEVRLFAQARERVGSANARLELPDGSRVADALTLLEQVYPALAELRPHLALAIDGTLARGSDALADGNELSLLPPVSGG